MPPLRLADIFARREHATISPCEASGCDERTRHGKNYCTDHVFHQPYVKRLIEVIEASVVVDADAERSVPSSVSVTNNVTVGDLVMHLTLHGIMTKERLTRDLRINQKALDNYASALENQGIVAQGTTTRGSTTLRLSEAFRNEITSNQDGGVLRMAAICYNDADAKEDGVSDAAKVVETTTNGVKPNGVRQKETRPKSRESEVVEPTREISRQIRLLEAAHSEHLDAVEAVLCLRQKLADVQVQAQAETLATKTDDARKLARQRLDDVIRFTETLDAGLASRSVPEKPAKPASAKSRAKRQEPASAKNKKSPKADDSNSGRVFRHLLKNAGKPVPATALLGHIHTKPKHSSMQANLASIVARFKRRGHKVTSLDINGAKHYRLEGARSR